MREPTLHELILQQVRHDRGEPGAIPGVSSDAKAKRDPLDHDGDGRKGGSLPGRKRSAKKDKASK
jgi:hypothetical protein